ncbi:MAG: PAS domain-containing sensor histidine kinase [Pseudomonadota bacterium]
MVAESSPSYQSRTERSTFEVLLDWARRVKLERKLALTFLVLGLTLGTVTFVIMTGDLPVAAEPQTVLLVLISDLVLLLGFSALIARRLVVLWSQRKKGLAGARLHGRLVALFSLVAVTPTILVAVFSVMLFDFGLKVWFSERVSTAIKNSVKVAEAYTDGHVETINADALAIAQLLNRRGPLLIYNPRILAQVLTQQAEQRDLTEVAIYDGSGHLFARADNFLLAFNPNIPDWAMEKAQGGEVVVMASEDEERVRALVRLDFFNDAVLYLGRLVDPRVLGHLDRTRGAVQLYEELEGKRDDLQIAFALIFAVVALMLLLAAIWVGLAFANHLTGPIGSLIAASERVGAGDLSVRVSTTDGDDEIGSLARAFNRMTGRLESQQSELLNANRLLDDRSRFIEAVLGGVSAGVIGLDRDGCVTLPNRSACELLETEIEKLRGHKLSGILPEVAELLLSAGRRPGRLAESNLSLQRRDGSTRILLVRVVAEADEGGIIGFVVTFDDVTELLSAQRKAAWSDIARRIAHEIKNPLTPIQLSAERLQRKYLGEISSDTDTFKVCTDTIIRHVGDIGRMVDEFSSFARMPAPVLSEESLDKLVEQAVFLQTTAHPDITFVKELPEEPVILSCDGQQVMRALTNLLLNAGEAIEARQQSDPENDIDGQIVVRLSRKAQQVTVEILDNGKGLPMGERHRLTEPYVTTRERGTGLGLAIVKKIMEDHGGELTLLDRESGGAAVVMVFPVAEAGEPAASPSADAEQRRAV